MSAHKTERLLNLVICLLSTRQFLAKEQIRTAVPQYAECPSDEAFDRMFERDKEELRDMGIPLETGGNDAWFDDEVGYRVDRAAYALPEVSFTPTSWPCSASRPASGSRPAWPRRPPARVLKLKAAGVEPDLGSLVGIEPRVRTSEPAFEPVYAAVRDRRPIRFPYRTPGQAGVTERHLEPWGIVSRHGRWYVVGHDLMRGATRVFRLSRVAGPVRAVGRPGDVQVPVGHRPAGPGDQPGAATGQRRGQGLRPPRPRGSACGAGRRPPAPARATGGWDELTVPLRRPRGARRGDRGLRRRRHRRGAAESCGTRWSDACAACWGRPPWSGRTSCEVAP